MTEKEITVLMDTVRNCFSIDPEAEITLEANPGTVTKEKAKTWKQIGINRVSMGAQAMQDHLLRILSRIHSKEEILSSVQMLREAGFTNLSLDLMFGLPSQTMEDWMNTLKEAADLGMEHLSCYSLILEEGTPFFEAV